MLCDLFTEPHKECGTCCEREYYCEETPDTSVVNDAALRKYGEVQGNCLHKTEYDGTVSYILLQDLLAFLAFLLKLLKSGYRHSQKLHDDRCVDVRRYAHRKYRCHFEGTTGYNVKESSKGSGHFE